MAFVTYMFSDEEKKEIQKKYDLRITYAPDAPAILSVNVYDSERNARLIFMSKGFNEIPGAFAFIWNEMTCCIITYLMDSDNEKHLFIWKMPVIYIPATFNGDEKELLALIQEAFDNFIIKTSYCGEMHSKIIFTNNFKFRRTNGYKYKVFIS